MSLEGAATRLIGRITDQIKKQELIVLNLLITTVITYNNLSHHTYHPVCHWCLNLRSEQKIYC